MTREQEIAQSLETIRGSIAEAALRNGRRPEEITLVAVTKGCSIADLLAAYRCGLRNFGENRVQEALVKVPVLPEDISWHLIGQLQRNKARKAVEFATLIHSLDRLSLAQTLNTLGQEQNQPVSALVQVNVSGEESKTGVNPADLQKFLVGLEEYSFLTVKGLMTIGPQNQRGEKARPYFTLLRELAGQAAALKLANVQMDILSMGMTDDFEVAIAEGSNLVRIGRGIFGPRP